VQVQSRVLSTSVRTTLRMRAIYKNQFLPWQPNESAKEAPKKHCPELQTNRKNKQRCEINK